MIKKFVFILGLFCCGTAYAHTLHVGDKSFQLDTVKRTSPALGVGIDGGTFYGALYSGDAPEETMRVRRGDDVYWLGQNCAAGKYSENGITSCADCGVGYYCTGGISRVPCTYGAMSCKTKNNTADAAMPAGAPLNNFLTLDEVNEFIPVTDFSDWRQISCCGSQGAGLFYKPETLNDASNACATGTIGPGTYLFTARYGPNQYTTGFTDSIDGTDNRITNAFIAVFDHPVAYASMHGAGIFQHFVDTENTQYKSYTISTTQIEGWMLNKNATNISNLANMSSWVDMLCVFELK